MSEGVQKEFSGSCALPLSPGEDAAVCPQLFNTPSSRVALGDAMRPRMQRSGFFGGTGFSGERSFLGLLDFKSLLQCFVLLCIKSPSAARSDCICDLFLSFLSTSSLLSNSIFRSASSVILACVITVSIMFCCKDRGWFIVLMWFLPVS